MSPATLIVCPRSGELLDPKTIAALRALADAARRQVIREQATAARHAEHRRKQERRRKALIRHIKRSHA